ncbi:MAG TPA: hypothetical protein VL171_12355 [Verrucomicrobiae bacterium]|nr:hypothetical protein [Verrucomicrobiae bacterium]
MTIGEAGANKLDRNSDEPERLAPVKDGNWFCPSCGGVNPEINVVCRDCAQHVRHSEQPALRETTAEMNTTHGSGGKQKKITVFAIGIIFAFVAILAAMVMKANDNSESANPSSPPSSRSFIAEIELQNQRTRIEATHDIAAVTATIAALVSVGCFLVHLTSGKATSKEVEGNRNED